MIWDASGTKRYDKAKEEFDEAGWYLNSLRDRLVEQEAYIARSRVPLFTVPSVLLALSVGFWYYLTTIVGEGHIPGYGNWVLGSMLAPLVIIAGAAAVILHNYGSRRSMRKAADKMRLAIEKAKIDMTKARHLVNEIADANDTKYERLKAAGEIIEVEVINPVQERLEKIVAKAGTSSQVEWEAVSRGRRLDETNRRAAEVLKNQK